MSRSGMIATTVIGGVIIAAAGATILAVLTRAILNGQGIAIAVLVIGLAYQTKAVSSPDGAAVT
jgi:hypothetical protein